MRGMSQVIADLARFGPERCEAVTGEQALDYTRALVRSHYENFSVVSVLLPRELRDDFGNVYAFCRWADDLGDEAGDPQRALDLLAWWRRELDACYDGRPRHPVFIALRGTIQKHDIPREPFDHLIDAFVQDQTVTRYATWDQVVDYCTRSADPVGRLVLYMTGYRDAERQRFSDTTCTALQLANFWQDVRRDIVERDRVYIPDEVASRHGLDLSLMVKAVKIEARTAPPAAPGGDTGCDCASGPSGAIRAILPAYRETVRELVQRTWPLFAEGRRLWPLLHRRHRPQIKLFTYGGESILRMIRRQRYDTLTRRPSLSKAAKLGLITRVMAGTLWPGG